MSLQKRILFKRFTMQSNSTEISKVQDEVVDIDLNDPDVAIAALKIQAGFKGFKARKHLQEKQV